MDPGGRRERRPPVFSDARAVPLRSRGKSARPIRHDHCVAVLRRADAGDELIDLVFQRCRLS